MANPLKDKTEDEIVAGLSSGSIYVPDTPLAQIQAEMLRRLLVSIRDFNAESARQGERMIRLTRWIIGLTIILGIIAAVQLFVMLKGGA